MLLIFRGNFSNPGKTTTRILALNFQETMDNLSHSGSLQIFSGIPNLPRSDARRTDRYRTTF
ncbi:MAG: hypothetical protein ABI184_02100 [Ginsengibacter sp.]